MDVIVVAGRPDPVEFAAVVEALTTLLARRQLPAVADRAPAWWAATRVERGLTPRPARASSRPAHQGVSAT